MVTLVPLATDVPPGGFSVTTLPLLAVPQLLVAVGAAVSPAPCRALVAWAWVCPVTSGTATWLLGAELVLCGDETEGVELELGLVLGPSPPLVLANATA